MDRRPPIPLIRRGAPHSGSRDRPHRWRDVGGRLCLGVSSGRYAVLERGCKVRVPPIRWRPIWTKFSGDPVDLMDSW